MIFRILYIHKEDCSAIKRLKNHFMKDTSVEITFLKRLPEDILENGELEKSASCIVFDDLHHQALTDKNLGELLYEIASIKAHHFQLYVFLCLQSFDIVKKQSKLHNVFLNSSHLIFFRTAHDSKAIKRYLNNYDITLKSSVSLWQIFQKYVQSKRYAYMLICVSPRCEKQTVFSNILMNAEGPMLSFHESDEEEL